MTLSYAALILWASLALSISAGTFWIFAPLCFGLALGILIFFLGDQKRALLTLLAAGLVLSGISLALQHQNDKPDNLTLLIENAQLVQVEVEILDRPKQLSSNFSASGSFGVSVRVHSIDGKNATGRGYLTYKSYVIERGQLVSFEGFFQNARDNPREAFILKATSNLEVLKEPQELTRAFDSLRRVFLANVSGLTPDSTVLVGGLAIGEIGELSPELAEQMKTVSLTHLVAVSGSNCAIVVGLVYLIAIRLGFGNRGRTLLSLLALTSYVMLVGPDPSVLRAGVMTAVVILTIASGRRGWAINSLAIAGIVLLIADPWLALEYGFGLSVLATAGILLLAPALAEKLSQRMPKNIALALSVTIASQITCLPLLLQLQPGIATYSIVANLIAAPVVAPVTVLGILAVLVSAIFPSGASLLSFLASFGTFWIESVAKFFSQLPITFIPWLNGTLAIVASVAVILLFLTWLKSKSISLQSVSRALLLFIASLSLSVPAVAEVVPGPWPMQGWQLTACDVGQGDALVVSSLGRTALIDVGSSDNAIDSCLRKLRVRTIDLLVLTHFDFDHVGGLSGAIKNREVDTVLISAFPDERPNTKEVLAEIALIGAEIVQVDEAINGSLGEFNWQVLSPIGEASLAEDANDASIVMSFLSPNLDLLFLGDLGQAGQDRIRSRVARVFQGRKSPLVLKVSHHGSNDQSLGFHELLSPRIAIFSVGKDNGYGHPGKFALDLFREGKTISLRTDQLGSIAIKADSKALNWIAAGG